MRGIFGTSASLASDLSLLFTVIFGAVAVYGALQAHQKRFSSHCPLMAAAALANWIPVLLHMIPKWASVGYRTEALLSGPLVAAPLFHGALGLITQSLMTYTVVRMYWLKQLPPEHPLWLMRITLTLWLLMVVGGVATYVLYVAGL
ncbi:MAG: hypothetical protein ACOYYS_15080 [Chloroflexota bacterium]